MMHISLLCAAIYFLEVFSESIATVLCDIVIHNFFEKKEANFA